MKGQLLNIDLAIGQGHHKEIQKIQARGNIQKYIRCLSADEGILVSQPKRPGCGGNDRQDYIQKMPKAEEDEDLSSLFVRKQLMQ